MARSIFRQVLEIVMKNAGVSRTGLTQPQKVHAVLSVYRDEWRWNDVDVARAMQRVLPHLRDEGRILGLAPLMPAIPTYAFNPHCVTRRLNISLCN